MDEGQAGREYLAAVEEIEGLLRLDRDDTQDRRLDALADFVEAYEDEHYPIRDMSDAEAEEILGIDCSDVPEITEFDATQALQDEINRGMRSTSG